MTHTSTEQPEARDLAYWIAHTTDNPTAALIQSLHASVQELEADNQSLRGINEDQDKALAELEKELSAAKDRIAELEVSQAQRVPLDAYSLRAILKKLNANHDEEGWNFGDLVREVEAYHGITQEKQG